MQKILILVLLIVNIAWGDDCGAPGTLIETIQGEGDQSPFVGKRVTIEAIVTAHFQKPNELNGFFVQQQDRNKKASHGLFVYSNRKAEIGDRLRLKGTVKEYYGLTELTNVTVLANCGNERPPKALPIRFNLSVAEREALEGVFVSLPESEVVANHELDVFGQLMLSDVFLAGSDLKPEDTWYVDDASSRKNPQTIHYLSNVSSLEQLALKASVDSFKAIISFSFDEYRLFPLMPLELRSPSAEALSPTHHVRVAAVNVGNLFNGDGRGNDFLRNRGAQNASEYASQLNAISTGLNYLNADLFVLNEVENDGFGDFSTVNDLLTVMNDRDSKDRHYSAIEFSKQQVGSSAIQNIMVFNDKHLDPVGPSRSILESSDWRDGLHRPFLAQSFREVNSGGEFSIVSVHLKSKGGRCPGDTKDLINKHGACDQQRFEAVTALNEWVNTWAAERPIIALGDFNAHPNEVPIKHMLSHGWVSTADLYGEYSYVFKGEPNILDYAFMHKNNKPNNIVGRYVNINAGLPMVLSKSALSRISKSDYVGFSDHDPVVIDIDF